MRVARPHTLPQNILTIIFFFHIDNFPQIWYIFLARITKDRPSKFIPSHRGGFFSGENMKHNQPKDTEATKERKGFLKLLDGFFGITASGSSFRTEIIAGLTTFMAMVYALLVVPGMYSGSDGTFPYISFDAVYIATALGAIVGTMLMAFLAKMPLAQASGLGATAYVTGTLLGGSMGLSYANAMLFVLLGGAIFVLLTATGLRKKILEGIPKEVKVTVPVGIGMFIAFIGFQNAGVVNLHEGSIGFASFNVLGEVFSYKAAMGALVALLGAIAIAALSKWKVRGSILWGMLGSTALYYALIGLGCAWNAEGCRAVFTDIAGSMEDPFKAFAAWGRESVGQVFAKGFNFGGIGAGQLVVVIITTSLSLCMLNMFDTLGTLYGACSKGGLLDEEGNPVRANQCMLADALGTCAGAVFGATTVTTYVESSSGVAAGGRTGFTALVTGLCFIVAMFLSPIAKLIPAAATSAALIWVGVLMMSSVKDVAWDDPVSALPAFFTIAVMAFGYSISFGIGVGLISCVLVKVCTGKIRELTPVTWIIALLFLVMFIFTN